MKHYGVFITKAFTDSDDDNEIDVEVHYNCTEDVGDAWNPPSGEVTITAILDMETMKSVTVGTHMEALLRDEAWQDYKEGA